MRVTHITWGYPSEAEKHEATYFANQVESLARIGSATINVLAPMTWMPGCIMRRSPRLRVRMDIPRSYEYNGIQVYRPRFIRLLVSKPCGDLFLLDGVMRRQLVRMKPDLVHVHGANAFGLAGLNAAKALGVPSILTLHGGDVYITPFLGKRYLDIFLKAMHTPVRRIAVSADLAETASLTANVQVTHLPLGIDLRRYAARIPKDDARKKFDLPQDRHIVLYLGNLLLAKGVQVLLDALGMPATGAIGVFAGSGLMAPMVQQHPNAKWIGPVSYKDVPALICAADILVLPSFSEGLGTVLVEAGALGIPVIGTNVGGIPALLNNDRGYLIPVNDPLSLSQCIIHALANPSAANRNARRLQEFVKEHYDADVNATKLMELYGQLL